MGYGIRQSGFALPTVLITSITMMVLLLASINSLSSISVAINNQYFDKLAQEAAESGVNMAVACIETNDQATWSNSSPLKPGSACTGTTGTGSYVLNRSLSTDNPKLRSSFIVTGVTTTGNKVKLTVQAKVEQLRNSNNQPWKTNTISRSATLSLPNFELSSGNDTTCATLNGELYCWGDNSSGQIGNGNTTNQPSPQRVNSGPLAGKYAYNVASGLEHTCALAGTGPINTARTNSSTDNVIYCWGKNDKAQIGLNTISSASTIFGPTAAGTSLPQTITDPDTSQSTRIIYDQISASHNTCVIGKLETTPTKTRTWCWGDNETGESAENPATTNANPKRSPTIGNATSAADNYAVRYARNNDATDSTSNSTVLSDAASINVVNSNSGCVVTTTNKGLCWGTNAAGQLGVGTLTNDSVTNRWRAVSIGGTPTSPISSNYRFTKVVTNWGRVCALGDSTNSSYTAAQTGKIYCWGANSDSGTNIDYRISTDLNGLEYGTPQAMITTGALASATFKDIAISDWNACAIRSDGANDGKVYCWGYNNRGQLGVGTTSPPPFFPESGKTPGTADRPLSPNSMIPVAGPLADKKVVKIASGNNHFCATTTYGSTYCWGANYYGQVGDGTITADSPQADFGGKSLPVKTKMPRKLLIY